MAGHAAWCPMARSASSTAVCTCGFKVPEPEQPEQPQESPQQAEEEAGTPHHEGTADRTECDLLGKSLSLAVMGFDKESQEAEAGTPQRDASRGRGHGRVSNVHPADLRLYAGKPI